MKKIKPPDYKIAGHIKLSDRKTHEDFQVSDEALKDCLLYTSPSPRDS